MSRSRVSQPIYVWVSVRTRPCGERAPALCQAGRLSGCDNPGTLGEVPKGVSGWLRAGVLASDFPSFSLRPADSSAAPCGESSVDLWKVLWAERSVWPQELPHRANSGSLSFHQGQPGPGALAPRHRWLCRVQVCGAGAGSTWCAICTIFLNSKTSR